LTYVWQLSRGNLHDRIRQLHEDFGAVVRIAPDELSFITDTAWQDIYCGGPWNKGFPKHEAYRNAQGMRSLFDAPDKQHAKIRQLLQKNFFSLRAARRQERIVQEYGDKLIGQLRTHFCQQIESEQTKPPVDLLQWYTFVAFDTIGRLVLSEDFGCFEGHEYHPWIQMVVSHLKLSAVFMCTRLFPPLPAVLSRMVPSSLRKLEKNFIGLLLQKVARRQSRNLPPGEQDLVSIAAGELYDDSEEGDTNSGSAATSKAGRSGQTLSQAELESNCFLILVAGSETVATSLLSSTHLVCEHPEVMRKLVAEVRAVAQHESELDFQNTANKMPYLNAVLR
jgi:cytochrome P450